MPLVAVPPDLVPEEDWDGPSVPFGELGPFQALLDDAKAAQLAAAIAVDELHVRLMRSIRNTDLQELVDNFETLVALVHELPELHRISLLLKTAGDRHVLIQRALGASPGT